MMYIADGSIDAATKFLERAEQTIKGLSLFPASGAPFPSRHPELAGVRTKLVKDFPNHVARAGVAIQPATGLNANVFLVDETQHNGFDRQLAPV